MTKQELTKKVSAIIAHSGDPERAHSEEDDLHVELINEFCPEWVKSEVDRLSSTRFPRWCA